jgi:hypothetical protein
MLNFTKDPTYIKNTRIMKNLSLQSNLILKSPIAYAKIFNVVITKITQIYYSVVFTLHNK